MKSILYIILKFMLNTVGAKGVKIKKQLFFSHTWKNDKLDRNNHERVYELARKLRKYGWSTWVDQDDMGGNIDASMAEGIDNAEVIIVCLTEMYFKKVNETARDPRLRDNCLKEWTYANTRNKLMVPVIMEPCLYNISDWPEGVVSLYLGSTLYMNGTNDNQDTVVIDINKTLLGYDLFPANGMDKNYQLTNNVVNILQNKSNRIIDERSSDGANKISTSLSNASPHHTSSVPKRSSFRRSSSLPHRLPPDLIPNRYQNIKRRNSYVI